MSIVLDTDPIFAPEAQEVFCEGCRVFTIEPHGPVGAQAEGTYLGHTKHGAFVGFDTPSGEDFRVSIPFSSLRNLYR